MSLFTPSNDKYQINWTDLVYKTQRHLSLYRFWMNNNIWLSLFAVLISTYVGWMLHSHIQYRNIFFCRLFFLFDRVTVTHTYTLENNNKTQRKITVVKNIEHLAIAFVRSFLFFVLIRFNISKYSNSMMILWEKISKQSQRNHRYTHILYDLKRHQKRQKPAQSNKIKTLKSRRKPNNKLNNSNNTYTGNFYSSASEQY